MQDQAIGQLAFHREHRVQAGHRLLKDHPDFVAPHRLHDLGPGVSHVQHGSILPHKRQRAMGDDTAAKLDQPHQGQRGDRFARPAFAHNTDRLAGVDGEADIFNPDNGAAIGGKFDLQTVN